jgi:hypothetical protein
MQHAKGATARRTDRVSHIGKHALGP